MSSPIVICSDYADTVSFLKEHEIPYVHFKPCGDVSVAIGGHADLVCHYLLGRDVLVYHKCTDLACELNKQGYNVILSSNNVSLGVKYPRDVLFNAFRIGNHVFCNTDFVLPQILSYYKSAGVNIHHVNQGYTNCSCLKLHDNAMITTDVVIHNIALGLRIDCLLISTDTLVLPPYPHGFIGGCGASMDDGVLFLTGRYCNHPDYDRISEFLHKHDISVVCGDSDRLLDLGIISLR